jgi:tetratricopeptide (TPR) repeat protein
MLKNRRLSKNSRRFSGWKVCPLHLLNPRIHRRKIAKLKSRERKTSHQTNSPFVKKIIRAGTISVIAASFFLANAPSAFAKPQRKPAGSGQENVDPLVNAAMKNMETGVWSVNGTVQAKKTIKLQGLLAGEDFDLAMEPGVKPNTPMREIVIKDKAWICSDGETWHAGRPDDRLIYNWAHVPIMADRKLPSFEKVGSEQRDGQTWLHVRLKVPEKNIKPKELPQYWLVLDSQGQAQYIGHTEMPMFSQARKEVMYCSFDYAPAKEKIAPPPLGAPVDDKAYGFNDIEQRKFDWKGKVVRLEVTPKILESKQIGEDTYRAFLKDTATPNHYGVVEFPHDALVKLGFLKKIVDGAHATEELEKMGALGRTDGKPVSFYVQVIPIGEKPAARTVAVGARLMRDPDGSVSYTWDSDETGKAKSSPAPAASDAPDGDLVNQGIEKAKNGDLDGAIADFNRAAELNPKDDAPYYNRAQARRLTNDTAGAIADYTKAIELGSTNPAAYNNRGNARAENKDRDGAIADYTRAIELKPDYARAYYNRATLKKEKGDAAGAAADFKTAQKLDPGLVSEAAAPESSSNRGTENRQATATTVSLLDGKLKLDIPPDFSRDADDPKSPKTLARFSGPDGAWGEVLRGTHGLTPDKLDGYLKMRVAEYSKGFNWLPKDSHLQWLKKDIVAIDGLKWADWRYVPMLKGTKDYSHSPVYTRFLTTSYKGQLLEITFTSNLNTDPKLKKEIDHIMDSVHLEE